MSDHVILISGLVGLNQKCVEREYRFAGTAIDTNLGWQIKYYLEGSGKDAVTVGQLLPKVITELRDAWMEAERNHLEMP